jgi:protoheme IX farnesyltransferase
MTGSVDLGAIYLFAIVFYWTPPHFWALALNKTRDYGKAGIPMMPNVHGVPETKRQMLLYTMMLIPLTIMPAVVGITGWFYGIAAALLGLRFLQLCWVILREDGVTPTTWRLYKFSLSYLALLFVAMAVDRYVPLGHPDRPVRVTLEQPDSPVATVLPEGR